MVELCLDNIINIYDFCPDWLGKCNLFKSIANYYIDDLCFNYSKEFVDMIVRTGYFDALYYVKERAEEIYLAIVKQNGLALYYVKEQTEEICLSAVQQDGTVLKYVKNQTEEICLAAVQQYWGALYYVKNQTQEICLAAVKQDDRALEYVKMIV